MDALKHPRVGPECRASSVAGVALDFAAAIAVIIPRPLVHTVAEGGMGWMAPPIALPLIGMELRAAGRNVFIEEATASPPVRVVAYPKALLTRVARDDVDDGGPIVGRGAMAFALIGTSTWRVTGIAMGRAVFPPRSGTVRRPQTPCGASHQRVRYYSGPSARAGATCAVACAASPTHGLSARWVRLSPYRAAGGPAGRGVGESFQRRCWSAAYSSRHTRGNGRPENGPAAESVGARGYDSEACKPLRMQVTFQPE